MFPLMIVMSVLTTTDDTCQPETKMKLAAGYNPTGGNGWISSPPHHQHPSSRHHGLRLEGCYQTNMCQKSQCKWPGVYVVLHRTAIFTFAFAFDKCFEETLFYFLLPGTHEFHLGLDRNI